MNLMEFIALNRGGIPPMPENPAIANYRAQVQQQMQMPDQVPTSPFESGVGMAMNAARQSLGFPSPQQRQRQAFGRGMISFGQAMGQPYEDKFGAINQALGAGINSYVNQMDQAQQEENQLKALMYQQALHQQELQQKYQQRQEEKEADRELRREIHDADLEERKRQHDLMSQYHRESLETRREKGKEEGMSGEGIKGLYGVEYIPLAKKDTEWKKVSEKEKSNLVPNQRAVKTVSEMKEIFNKYPEIGTSFLNLLEEGKTEGSILNYLGRMFVNKDELTAIQRLKKLSADLNLSTVMGLPGRSNTDIMKRAVQQSAPSGKLTKDAFNSIANEWVERANHNIKRIKVIEDAEKKGMKPLFSTMEEENSSEIPQASSMEDLSQLSNEELMKLYQNE